MITISATQLKDNFFDYLEKVTKGETVVIHHDNQDVAQLFPIRRSDWRDNMKVQPRLLVSPEEIIKPMEDIWEDHI